MIIYVNNYDVGIEATTTTTATTITSSSVFYRDAELSLSLVCSSTQFTACVVVSVQNWIGNYKKKLAKEQSAGHPTSSALASGSKHKSGKDVYFSEILPS